MNNIRTNYFSMHEFVEIVFILHHKLTLVRQLLETIKYREVVSS